MVRLDGAVCHAILAQFGGVGLHFRPGEGTNSPERAMATRRNRGILRCCHDPVVITLQALLGLFELRLAPDRRR